MYKKAIAILLFITLPVIVIAQNSSGTRKSLNVERLTGKSQTKNASRPKWATIAGTSFITKEAEVFGVTDAYEKGYFVSGSGESLFRSMQDALLRYYDYLNFSMSSYISDDGTSCTEYYCNFPEISSLVDLFDVYYDNAGRVYTLMFISDSNLLKVLENNFDSLYYVEHRVIDDGHDESEEIRYYTKYDYD